MIQNNQQFYMDIGRAVKEHFSYKSMDKITALQVQNDVYVQALNIIEKDIEVNTLLLDEDKNQVEAYFHNAYSNGQYELILSRVLGEKRVTLLEVVFHQYDIKYLAKNIIAGKYRVKFYQTINNNQNTRLFFLRNKIGSLPDAELIRKKYNRIQNILLKFLYRCSPSKLQNCLIIDKKFKDFQKSPNSFFDGFLANNHFSVLDQSYFDKILSLNAHKSRLETIWTYNQENLKELGFKCKEDISIFDNKLDNIKKSLYPFKVKQLFDFQSGNIEIIIETGEKIPNHIVLVKIKKDESITNILDKELYKYSSVLALDYIKVDGIYLKDYIQNKEEVIELIKLVNY